MDHLTYLESYDQLAIEEELFAIPIRKELLIGAVGSHKRVLDVGCLGGKISRLLIEKRNEVWGIEINPRAARQAERRGVRVQVGNVEEGLPYDSGFFDLVHAGEIAEHVYDTKLFFRECARVLKPGGELICATYNLNSFENRARVLVGGFPTHVGAYPEDHGAGHVRVFNLHKLRELLEQAGLEVFAVQGVPLLTSQGKWVDRALAWVGRKVPEVSKVLILRARKSQVPSSGAAPTPGLRTSPLASGTMESPHAHFVADSVSARLDKRL